MQDKTFCQDQFGIWGKKKATKSWVVSIGKIVLKTFYSINVGLDSRHPKSKIHPL